MTFHVFGNDTVSLEEEYEGNKMKNNKPFKPYLIDIWSNTRYGDKKQAENYGQVYTVKITENISENLISDILNAAAKAHLNHNHNTQNTSEFDHTFGYEIREIEPKPFLVPFYYSLLNEDKPVYYRHIIIKAIDLEDAKSKAEGIRLYVVGIRKLPASTDKVAMYNLGDADRFDPAMIEEIEPEQYKFLISRGTFISYVEQ